MSTLLVKNSAVLVTMDEDRREIASGGFYAENGRIQQVGSTSELPQTADEILDLSGHIVFPGLINTHHHFFQTLTRAVPEAQDAGLFQWLRAHFPIWARMTSEHVYLSTQVALAELALSGCTTAADHLYMYPNGSRMDDQVAAAETSGLRVHLSRGGMSLGQSHGGLPPDSITEDEKVILDDVIRTIEAFHDGAPGSMLQVVVAPCAPFAVSLDLMREAACVARDKGVRLHTHVAETLDEEQFCLDTYGMRPVELMEDLDWVGPDVWFAHSIFVNDSEIPRLAGSQTGVAHCPTSNMRLASGIAPTMRYLKAGVKVGIGVDGSASNDGNHMLAEARQAMLLARLSASPAIHGGELMTARQALEMATRGSAAVLGRTDIGSLEIGKCADFAAIRLDRIEYAGAIYDPVAAILLAAPVNVDHSYVHGRAVVDEGTLVTLDLPPLIERHNQAARRLIG